MAENIDKLALEYYLRRKVSHCNKTINGLCQEKGVKQSIIYNTLLSRFCAGRGVGSDILEKIYYNIERNNPYPDMRPYAFFDLDTIYAYYTYLRKIVYYARFGKNDMNDAVNLAIGDLLNPDTPLEQCGFYDVNNPVTLRTVDGREMPLKRMSTEKFAKTYEELVCRDMLSKYSEERKISIGEKQKDISEKQTEDNYTSIEEIKSFIEDKKHKEEKKIIQKKETFEYDGITYDIISKEYKFQHRDNFTPLFQVDAISIDGKYRLSANVDMNNKVYQGIVISNKCEKISDNSPIEVICLQPSEEDMEKRRKQKGITKKPKVNGEFSMHELFDDF